MSVLELYNKAQGNVTISDMVFGKTSNSMSSYQPVPVEVTHTHTGPAEDYLTCMLLIVYAWSRVCLPSCFSAALVALSYHDLKSSCISNLNKFYTRVLRILS